MRIQLAETQYKCLFDRMKIWPLLMAGVALKSSVSDVILFVASFSNVSDGFRT